MRLGKLRFKEVFQQLQHSLIFAIPIAALLTFLIGVVVAYLFSSQAVKYGGSIFIVDAVSIAMCRELSPILIAILVAGRSGSAFTAQIGTMKLNEEIDAMRVMGLRVMRVLVLPRVFALAIGMPLLVTIGSLAGIVGGMVVANFYLGITPNTFLDRMQSVLLIKHVYVGLVKAPIFAAFIACIGCYMGLTTEDNARSVGIHTTSTVVQSIVAVILLNAFFAVVLVELKI
jgi:phospholipid/cholesterol/gamma-HCH transport system permease protein